MDIKSVDTTITLDSKSKTNIIRDDILYTIVFKDNKSTTLSYKMLCRFELFKTIIDESKSNSIELPNIDIKDFMSMLCIMLDCSKKNYQVIHKLPDVEHKVYEYLITDKEYHDNISNFKKELMVIVSAIVEVYLMEKADRKTQKDFNYNIETEDIRFKKRYNDGTYGIIYVYTEYQNGGFEIFIESSSILYKYTNLFSRDEEIDITIYNGLFKLMNYNADIITSLSLSSDDSEYVSININPKK